MANLKEVRTRIASVSSTQQITSAMKMVSAAKFRRAQIAILGMRPYANELNAIVADIDVADGIQTPYHAVRRVENVLLVAVASNKGLCGAFNANILKTTSQRVEFYQQQKASVQLITIGKRATEFFSKRKGLVVASYDDLLDSPSFDASCVVAERLMQDFCERKFDRVEIIYNQFKNSISQILSTEQFLPVVPQEHDDKAATAANSNYIYEPDKATVLYDMIPLTLRSHFYRVILDSLAAEHGARMTAMQKATDNATELLKELRLSYNKARQAAITNEIIEIVSGSEALKS
ncbi:MAG: ATP synthase F1 subunit gamma [Bacteroidales bacterium]|nr:ATP synthase F1 subunit gamma [Bacteroidales bacterium]